MYDREDIEQQLEVGLRLLEAEQQNLKSCKERIKREKLLINKYKKMLRS